MAYNGYTPEDKFDYPEYVAPDMSWLYDTIRDQYGTQQDIAGNIMDSQPNRMLPAIMRSTGVTGGQLGDWLTKKMTGAGAKRRAAEWKDIQMNRLNRGATRDAERLRQTSAETGGQGSSSAARQEVEGRAALRSARGDVDAGAMEYEDRLRSQSMNEGMAGLGLFSNLNSADEAAQQNWLSNTAQAGSLLNQAGNQLINIGGMQVDQATLVNAYNQWRYQVEHTGEDGGGFMEFLGQVVNAGATLGAATL